MNTSKKTFAIVASATAAVLVGGGVAVAYWTTTGNGTGSATAGTTAALTVTQVGAPSGLFPGGPAQNLTINVENAGPSDVTVANVAVTITSVTPDPGNPITSPACTTADFAVTSVGALPASVVVTPGAPGSDLANVGTVRLVNNPSANQDACKGATVNLAYAVS
jgi:hypothetical protein